MGRTHSATLLASMVTLAFTLILAIGCITDRDHRPETTGDEPVDVRLHLRTPGGFFAPRTRALSAADENTINNIYVLVFDRNDRLTAVHRGEDVEDNDGSGTGQFTVTLEPSMGGEKSKLVVLANAEDILDARGIIDPADPETPSGSVGDSYSDIIADIQASFTAPFSGSTIPMWGETPEAITIAASTGTQTIELMRSVARIDVGIGKTPAYDSTTDSWTWNGKNGAEDIPFDLTGVWIVNPNTAYTVIPAPGNVQNAGNNGRVTSPTTSGTPFGADTDQKAEAFGHTAITNSHYISRGIYVPEADVKITPTAKPGDANHNNRMALVIGGHYAGSQTPTYYRIDFATKEDGLLNVLRNHLYQFNISKVSGAGYPSVREAYEASAMNMTVEILRWDEGLITDIWVSGDDYFGIERRSVEFPSYGEPSREVAIKTNVADFTLTMGEKTLTPGGSTITSDNFSYSLTKKGGAVDLYTLTVTTLGANVSQNAPDPGRLDEWEIAFGIIEGVSFTVSQQWESTYISVANGASERVFPEGRSGDERIPIDIISSVPVTVALSSGADSWITGVPASIPSSGGIWSANLQLAIEPYKYGTDGTSNRSAIITITAGDETRRMTIIQESPLLSFDLPNVRLDRPATPGPVTRTVMIQTNLPADHLDFTFTDTSAPGAITHTIPAPAGIASRPRYLRFDVTADLGVGAPAMGFGTTFGVAPKASGIPDYGLTASAGVVNVRGAGEVFDFFWRRGTFLNEEAYPWVVAPLMPNATSGYFFPWNATTVEFDFDSNMGLFVEPVLTPGETSAPTVGVTRYPFTFDFDNRDRASAHQHTYIFTPEEESAVSFTMSFTQAPQIWSRDESLATAWGYSGTGAAADSHIALPVTSNVEWTAASSASWLTASNTEGDFATTVTRKDHFTAPATTATALQTTAPLNIHIDAITALNTQLTPGAATEPEKYQRTATITFTNLDDANGGLDLSDSANDGIADQALTITQYAPRLQLQSTTLPLDPATENIPQAGTTYDIFATTNMQGWGVRIYSTVDNDGQTQPKGVIATASWHGLTIVPTAPAQSNRTVNIPAPRYNGNEDRGLEFVLVCTEFPDQQIAIGTWTQDAQASLSIDPNGQTQTWDAIDDAARKIDVTSNRTWDVALSGTNADKFEISAKTGTDGNGSFRIGPREPNTGAIAYTATLTVSASGVADKVVTLTQSAAGATLRFTPAGDPSAFTTATGSATNRAEKTVTANVRWTATLEGGNADKFRFVTGTGFTTSVTVPPAATTDYTLGIEPVGANPTTTTYTTTVKLTSPDGAATQSFVVTQSPSAPTISLSPGGKQTWTAANTSANTVVIGVNANWGTAWEIDPASYDATQWSVVKSTNSFTVAPAAANGTTTPRTATLLVHGTSASGFTTTTATLDIEQAGESPSLAISPTTNKDWAWNATAADTRTVTSNVTYTVSLSGTNANKFRINDLAAGATHTSTTTGGTFTVSPIDTNTSGGTFTATVTVQGSDGSNDTKKTYTVTQAGTTLVSGITVSPSTVSVDVYATTTLSASVTPSNATDKGVIWSSSDLDIATVDASTGVVTGVAAGTATITATAQDGSGVTGTSQVTVVVTILTISPTTETSWAWNATTADTRTVTSNVTYTVSLSGDHYNKFKINSLAAGATYTSTSKGGSFTIAPIDNNISGSTYTATVTVQGSRGGDITKKTFTISQISSIPVTSISISPGGAQTVKSGGTLQLSATVLPTDATDNGVTWSSSNPAIATVDAASGLVKGVAAGTVTITAMAADGSNVKATCNLTVTIHGGYDDILILQGSGTDAYLDIGRWGNQINASNLYSTMAYFKWGSVVGFNNADGFTTFNSTIPGASTNAVKFNPATSVTWSNYANIPYYQSGDVADVSYTSLENVLAGRGDPCRLVGLTVSQIRSATPDQWTTYMENSQWRMPTNAENQEFAGSATDYTPSSTSLLARPSSGSWSKTAPGRMTFMKYASAVLPAAGNRSTTGAIQSQGIEGFYWSTGRSSSNAQTLLFYSSSVASSYNRTTNYGFPIRCVSQ